MHRLLAGLAVAGLLVLAAPTASAQTDPSTSPPTSTSACFSGVNQAAWNTLAQGYLWSPAGYGPFGFAPLALGFDPALAGAPPLYGAPPLPLPAYGPLGPGLTSVAIQMNAIPANGFGLGGLDNGTLLDLQTLQQRELATLNGRYGTGAAFQLAGTLQSTAATYEARSMRQIGRALCAAQALQAAAAALRANAATAAPPSAPASGGQP